MTNDILLVAGVMLAVLAVPAVVSAYSDGRSPRAPAIIVMIAGGLIVIAMMNWPGPFHLNDVPKAFVRVIGALFR
jgi:hypothetical protein